MPARALASASEPFLPGEPAPVKASRWRAIYGRTSQGRRCRARQALGRAAAPAARADAPGHSQKAFSRPLGGARAELAAAQRGPAASTGARRRYTREVWHAGIAALLPPPPPSPPPSQRAEPGRAPTPSPTSPRRAPLLCLPPWYNFSMGRVRVERVGQPCSRGQWAGPSIPSSEPRARCSMVSATQRGDEIGEHLI
eukprot:scaffold9563_cov39-Tisochrysis_lutea.AAC.2